MLKIGTQMALIWDHESLRKLIAERLADCRIILVSHREPYMHIYRGGEVQTIVPTSGVAIVQLLSPFTGAYRINPYNPEDTADVILQSLEDPPEHKAAHMPAIHAWVQEHNIFQWSAHFLQALIEISQGD